jgi:hypothetical protein
VSPGCKYKIGLPASVYTVESSQLKQSSASVPQVLQVSLQAVHTGIEGVVESPKNPSGHVVTHYSFVSDDISESKYLSPLFSALLPNGKHNVHSSPVASPSAAWVHSLQGGLQAEH